MPMKNIETKTIFDLEEHRKNESSLGEPSVSKRVPNINKTSDPHIPLNSFERIEDISNIKSVRKQIEEIGKKISKANNDAEKEGLMQDAMKLKRKLELLKSQNN